MPIEQDGWRARLSGPLSQYHRPASRRYDARLQAELLHDACDILGNLADTLSIGANTGAAHIVYEPVKKLLTVLIDIGKNIAQIQVFLRV